MLYPSFSVLPEDAEAERLAAPRWYKLPPGWTWARVAQERAVWAVNARQYPAVTAGGVTAWTAPTRPQRDRVRVPHTLRKDVAIFVDTAGFCRKVPGGKMAARKALDNARFFREHNDFRPAWG